VREWVSHRNRERRESLCCGQRRAASGFHTARAHDVITPRRAQRSCACCNVRSKTDELPALQPEDAADTEQLRTLEHFLSVQSNSRVPRADRAGVDGAAAARGRGKGREAGGGRDAGALRAGADAAAEEEPVRMRVGKEGRGYVPRRSMLDLILCNCGDWGAPKRQQKDANEGENTARIRRAPTLETQACER
jgi:hypothetical protein